MNQHESPESSKTPESQKPALAEGLDKDPRFEGIKDEFKKNWSKETSKDILSAEGQDYMFGDPTAHRRGEKPVTIEDRARKAFEERFPEDAKEYAEKEKTRIYENPSDDPAIKNLEENISRFTNRDVEQMKHGVWGENAKKEVSGQRYPDAWTREFNRINIQQWDEFTKAYPEKAEAYRDRLEPLREAFERKERKDKSKIDQKWEKNLSKKYEKLEDFTEKKEKLQKETESSVENLKKLRTSMGLPESGEKTASQKALEEIKNKLEKEQKNIDKLEKRFLEIPEEEMEESEIHSDEAEMNEKMLGERMDEKPEREIDEEKLKEARREAIKEFIEGAIQSATEDSIFREAKNGDVAQKLLAFKIEYTVTHSPEVKRYIEEDGQVDLKLHWDIDTAVIEIPGKEKIQYITGIEVKLYGMTGNESEADKGNLLSSEEETDMEKAREEENLKEKK